MVSSSHLENNFYVPVPLHEEMSQHGLRVSSNPARTTAKMNSKIRTDEITDY